MSNEPMTTESLVKEILSGRHDEDLTVINKALVSRTKIARDIKSVTLATTLELNTPVRIDGIRPKYLCGVTGKVTKIEGSRGRGYASIKFDKPIFGGGRMREASDGIPLSCLTVLE